MIAAGPNSIFYVGGHDNICRLLVYQTNGIPCELPDQALQMLIDAFLETFTLVETSSRTYQSSMKWKLLEGITIPKASAL